MRSSMRRKQEARTALSMCLLGQGTLHSSFETKLMNVGSGLSALLSKRELGKANSLPGRARGLVK
ncbi:hypothetical protein Lal_00001731 [Lupinus albus]|nr:hypothetical protein Lal_00001731 [Lupinus albus]